MNHETELLDKIKTLIKIPAEHKLAVTLAHSAGIPITVLLEFMSELYPVNDRQSIVLRLSNYVLNLDFKTLVEEIYNE